MVASFLADFLKEIRTISFEADQIIFRSAIAVATSQLLSRGVLSEYNGAWYLRYFVLVTSICNEPEGGGETTKSPKLTESESSSSRKVAEFHTKSNFSRTCSSNDWCWVRWFRILWGLFLIRMVFFVFRKMLVLVVELMPMPIPKPPRDLVDRPHLRRLQ